MENITINSTNIQTNKKEEYTFEDLSIVMGAMNEEKAIAKVIQEIDETTHGLAEIVVVVGGNDNTAEIARSMGAIVIEQEPQGYGIALKEAINHASRDVVITTDCDGTYPLTGVQRFLDYINEGYDVVGGIRLKGRKTMNMKPLNILGNYIFVLLVTLLYGKRVHDTTTGMRAYKKSMLNEINWQENTGLSAELLFKPIMYGYKVIEIPINYRPRLGTTKLDPLRGGWEIFYSIIKYKWVRLVVICIILFGIFLLPFLLI